MTRVPLHVERAMMANMAVLRTLRCEIVALETILHHEVRLRPEFVMLKTTPGIGNALAAKIMLETGAISRFASVGQSSSYCRCVDSRRISNGRKKGEGNTKNGNISHGRLSKRQPGRFAIAPRREPFMNAKGQASSSSRHEGARTQASACALLHDARRQIF
jgi:hypothetical protein